jgi:hypothetical protein
MVSPRRAWRLLFDSPGEVIAAADGRRFLVRAVVEETPRPPITLIVNWTPAAGSGR